MQEEDRAFKNRRSNVVVGDDDDIARQQIQLHRQEYNHDKGGSIFVIQFTGSPHKANVFSKPLVQRLDHLLDVVEENLPCTLILTGNGNFFSAGFDLQALTGRSHNKTNNRSNVEKQAATATRNFAGT